ncbi:penicillin-binding transpeptidase domain-containing protein [Halarsenatibacter silvermanii]|uniref:Stage V sporulation protein D (Sporulation-specific penicillin-binding protein) n=1 Tax=Halarsenatibacter silvermanii TaxID=321763 RepID=A0A1G9JN50_9FIRM|nr:penicillin-binding transpeptidase domain-containing protein [Halarsenatibacter silvermanii]SDL38970.1 stage V sporulation protein D (sporulation-specific penicillin-binding protein) [Halarsenatibacter silvermanii]
MSDRHSMDEVHNRIRYFLFLCLLVFIIITGRLLWLQIFQSSHFQRLVLNQRIQQRQVDSDRGKILDREGRNLAVNTSAPTIVALPEKIDDPASAAEKLAEVLSADRRKLESRISGGSQLVYLERQVSNDIYSQVEDLNLEGISSIEEPKRIYPSGDLAGQILGFTGIDNFGLEGLEYAYNSILSGNPGLEIREMDALGDNIPLEIENQNNIDGDQGKNIHLTIDETLQYFAENELKRARENYNASGGTIIAMDPENGDLLALANSPDFNPNNFQDFSSEKMRNRAISDNFEPGSVFKVFTASLFLEYGYYDMQDKLYDPGSIKVNDAEINCWSADGHGTQSFVEIFANSCNPGFVQMGLSMDPENLIEGLERFNFGKNTGIGLPGESSGKLRPDHYSEVEQATMSFGHGLSVTPLQLITAAGAIANDGIIKKPRLVRGISSSTLNEEDIAELQSERIRKAISPDTAKKVRDLMIEAVEEGTGQEAKMEGLSVGGKTGTSRHYGDEDTYDTSFLALVPGDDPELAVLVVLRDIEGKEDEDFYASENAVPVFKNLISNALLERDLLAGNDDPDPDEYDKSTEKFEIGNYRGLNARNISRTLRRKGLNVKLIGEGETVKGQRPLSGAEVNSGSTLKLFLDDAKLENRKVMVPDFRGLETGEAENLARLYGFYLNGSVSGEISYQSPPPGERQEIFDSITIE